MSIVQVGTLCLQPLRSMSLYAANEATYECASLTPLRLINSCGDEEQKLIADQVIV